MATKYRWLVASPDPSAAERIAKELGISRLLAQCMVNRGLVDPEEVARFLQPRLKHLSDPFLLPNMSAAVDRLMAAHAAGERLVVFGDYDVDGVTSTALLVEVLRRLGWTAEWYLPKRMDEGYGLTEKSLEMCLQRTPASLVLAVDCGSTAVAAVAWLKAQQIDTIVLDHHQVTSDRPDCVALVNPQVNGDPAGTFTELCSVGLAFKLAHALVKRGRQVGWAEALDFDLRPLLDLVALGTIADLVPLKGENRFLVAAGLERLNASVRPGLVALRNVAGLHGRLGSYEVAFQLGPRLNAAGRLEDAENALRLLLSADLEEAKNLAVQLDNQNRNRQRIERTILDEALKMIRSKLTAETFVIVEGAVVWHVGVVGVVAARIAREFYRPAIILGGDHGEWRGSGRSIDGFDLATALRECSDLLSRHGGHASAAGLSLNPERLDAFRERLNAIARRSLLPEQLQPALRLDADAELQDVELPSFEEFSRLQPFGQGNPDVQFAFRRLRHHRPPQRVGKEQRHLKCWVTDGTCVSEAVRWNAAPGELSSHTFDLAAVPHVNEFNGTRTVQLKIVDWEPLS